VNAKTILLLVGLAGAIPLGLRLAHSEPPAVAETFWSDGSPKSRVVLRDGRRDGPATQWDAGGRIVAEGSYQDDRREGRWVWYREDGSVDPERSGLYEDGERVRGL
jgi:antitoxin component YwqK of YwqJK toxin-antitoxin module